MTYQIIKALHVIGVIAWFAGLFYIFRLYVYHVENQQEPKITNLLEIMERRLYRAITTPAMIFTLIMGLSMIYLNPLLLQAHWIHAKFLALLFLFAYHFYAGHIRKEFAKQNFKLTSKQCRLINEVPTLILLIVVPLAILKPYF